VRLTLYAFEQRFIKVTCAVFLAEFCLFQTDDDVKNITTLHET